MASVSHPCDAALVPVSEVALSHSFIRGSQFNSMNVPSEVDSFMAVEGRWNFTGHLVADPDLAWHHTHPSKFHFS